MKKLTYLLLLFSTVVFSQTAGSLDTSFNTIDEGYDIISGTDNRVYCSKIQSDGKIVIGGIFTKYNGVNVNKIARLNTDGTLDTTFNIGTGFSTAIAEQGILKIVLQADSKILVVGTFTSYNGITCKDLVRLNSNGTLDTSFNIGLGFNNTISSISIQSNGKLFVCGAFTTFNNIPTNYLVKLNSDGSIDSSFDSTNSGADATINDLAIQTDGKVIIGGSFSNYAGIPQNKIARLNTDGTLDSSFNIGTGFSNSNTAYKVNSIAIQTDGKIIAGGNFTSFNGINIKNLIRLNTDGSIDTNFITVTSNAMIYEIKLQTDGKIIILCNGTFFYNSISRFKIARINTDGALDTTFERENSAFVGYLYNTEITWSNTFDSVEIQSDGQIILTGAFQTSYFSGANVKRLNANGTFDNSFNTKVLTGANGTIKSIAIQPDGKIIAAGNFSAYNSYPSAGIVRLNPDGTIDNSFLSSFFVSTTSGNLTTINNVAIQSDGRILVVGKLHDSSLYSNTYYKRLEVDGTFDSSFVITSGVWNSLMDKIYLQNDGKILITGSFTKRIVRFNTDGTQDTSFNIGTGISGSVADVKVQNDGKILIAGSFTSYNGITKSGIARINSNGVYDTTFTGTGASGTVNIIAIQNDGKILISGNFTSYNGTSTNGFIRLNSDGTIDTSFSISPLTLSINSISIQSDGKIIVAGQRTCVGCVNIIRLNINGSIDTSFNAGIGTLNAINGTLLSSIYTTVLQSDGKLLIGGDFTSCNNIGRNRIGRLNAANALSINENNIKNTFTIYPNPAKDNFTIDFGNEKVTNYSLKVSNMLGQEVYSTVINKPQFTVTKTWQGSGIYFVKVYDENNNVVAVKKIILQ